MNISSLIVDVRPDYLPQVRGTLGEWPGVDLHAATPEGKLIVTVEADGDAQTTETFGRLSALDGVMSVAMVYHQFDPDAPDEDRHDDIDPT